MGEVLSEEAGPSAAHIVTPEQLQRASKLYEQGLQHLQVSLVMACLPGMVIG